MKNVAFLAIVFLVAFTWPGDIGSSSIIIKGMASWYSEEDPGILETTANMERFDDKRFTCAIWGIPFNSILRVTNMENGRSIYVRVNDRGPARRLVEQGRLIDLTKAAFAEIGDLEKGLIPIKAEIII